MKEKKLPKYIIYDIEICYDSSRENFDEQILIKKIQNEKNSDYKQNCDEEILKQIRTKKKIDEENYNEQNSDEDDSSEENSDKEN